MSATDQTVAIALECSWCGHWEKGQRTKDQIASWLRVHRTARIGIYDGDREMRSTCPHPCGTPFVASSDPAHQPGDDR